jgi:benzoate/toluate 1,2-dioxygenase reductase subunit
MTYRIALNFEDGETRFIECKPGENVLDAAYRQKVNLPMDCSDGVCGTCKCHCEQGEYDLGDDFIEDALTEDEAQERLVLTCQMTPSSDCIISVPVPSTACKIKPAEHQGVITAVEQASDSTIVLRMALDRPEELNFLPGQYVNLTVPQTEAHRSYSFSSKPGSAEASFLIRNLEGGLMSGWLTGKAAIGERLSFVGPSGSFFLRAVERPVIMLAGGTGLAPLLSMLEVLADQGSDHPVHLIYGVNTDRDLVEMERLAALQARLPKLTFAACVVDEASQNELKGYVTHHLADEHLNAGDCDVYLCGPPPMVEAVRIFLRDKGVTPVHFYYEKFAASEPAQAAA